MRSKAGTLIELLEVCIKGGSVWLYNEAPMVQTYDAVDAYNSLRLIVHKQKYSTLIIARTSLPKVSALNINPGKTKLFDK